MSCKWDRDAEEYLTDGDPCKRDEYGDPTRHCTARRTCSAHVGPSEITCARCLSRARAALRRITPLAALALPVAVTDGVNSEAANLAGPAANPREWSDRRIAARGHLARWEQLGAITEEQHLHARAAMEDDDEQHPYSVLGRWASMIAEDYGHDLPTITVSNAADYLDRHLARIAQDPEQDFPLLAREIRNCARHLETVLSTAIVKQRGAPCPECGNDTSQPPPRLVREHGHWCDDEACERIHFDSDEGDVWQCPRNKDHQWTHEAYSNWIEDRRKAKTA